MPDHEISQRHAFAAEAGTISYIDCGEGPPVVFVHGNPSSAAHFEPVIAQLGGRFRTIAIDHLGFGQSDKPPSWDYRPEQHAANLSALLDSLDLTNVTLVAEDWGGPIGLSWCLDNPDRVDRLVLTNTWCWPVNRSLYYQFCGSAEPSFTKPISPWCGACRT